VGVAEDVATPGDVNPSPSSSISILPTSLLVYHKACMSGAPPPPSPAPSSPQINLQQTCRRLRPINMQIQSSGTRIKGLTPLPPSHAQQAKCLRQNRWQSGIRSGNSTLEAVGFIYCALRKLGAECELEECDEDEDGGNDEVAVAMTPALEGRLQAMSIQTQRQTLPPPMKEKRQAAGTPTKGIGFAFPLPPHFPCGEWLKEGVGAGRNTSLQTKLPITEDTFFLSRGVTRRMP